MAAAEAEAEEEARRSEHRAHDPEAYEHMKTQKHHGLCLEICTRSVNPAVGKLQCVEYNHMQHPESYRCTRICHTLAYLCQKHIPRDADEEYRTQNTTRVYYIDKSIDMRYAKSKNLPVGFAVFKVPPETQ